MIYLQRIGLILVIIGALNWGLIGIAGFDLVAFLFGPMSVLSRIVYTLVGLSGVLMFWGVPCSLHHSETIIKKA